MFSENLNSHFLKDWPRHRRYMFPLHWQTVAPNLDYSRDLSKDIAILCE